MLNKFGKVHNKTKKPPPKSTEYDNLIELMVSGHIFDRQYDSPQVKVPEKFKSIDHYFEIWDLLFKVELQAILLMTKRPNNKNRDEGQNFEIFNNSCSNL